MDISFGHHLPQEQTRFGLQRVEMAVIRPYQDPVTHQHRGRLDLALGGEGPNSLAGSDIDGMQHPVQISDVYQPLPHAGRRFPDTEFGCPVAPELFAAAQAHRQQVARLRTQVDHAVQDGRRGLDRFAHLQRPEQLERIGEDRL